MSMFHIAILSYQSVMNYYYYLPRYIYQSKYQLIHRVIDTVSLFAAVDVFPHDHEHV